MRKGSPLRGWAKWTCTLLCVVVASAWALRVRSGFVVGVWGEQRVAQVLMEDGLVWFVTWVPPDPSVMPVGFQARRFRTPADSPWRHARWRPFINTEGLGWSVGVPMWMLLFSAGAAAVRLWMRPFPRGFCRLCGYDLRGLAGGGAVVCPECGRGA